MWWFVAFVLLVGSSVAGAAPRHFEVDDFEDGLEDQVEYVVDTGPGRAAVLPGDLTLTSTQFQAAQFTLDSDATVVGIEGWLAYLSFAGDLPVEVVVYGDDGDLPDTTDVFWAQLFFVPSSGAFPYPGGWYGVDGISLELDAGTYWVAFEPPTDTAGTGAMPPTFDQELDHYAVGHPTAGWRGDDTLNLGLRIAAVPEPGALLQLASGVLGLLILNGRRTRNPSPRRAASSG
jgi:hypothetical protein